MPPKNKAGGEHAQARAGVGGRGPGPPRPHPAPARRAASRAPDGGARRRCRGPEGRPGAPRLRPDPAHLHAERQKQQQQPPGQAPPGPCPHRRPNACRRARAPASQSPPARAPSGGGCGWGGAAMRARAQAGAAGAQGRRRRLGLAGGRARFWLPASLPPCRRRRRRRRVLASALCARAPGARSQQVRDETDSSLAHSSPAHLHMHERAGPSCGVGLGGGRGRPALKAAEGALARARPGARFPRHPGGGRCAHALVKPGWLGPAPPSGLPSPEPRRVSEARGWGAPEVTTEVPSHQCAAAALLAVPEEMLPPAQFRAQPPRRGGRGLGPFLGKVPVRATPTACTPAVGGAAPLQRPCPTARVYGSHRRATDASRRRLCVLLRPGAGVPRPCSRGTPRPGGRVWEEFRGPTG